MPDDSKKPIAVDSHADLALVTRRPNGTILPGHPTIGGRTKGSLNKVTSVMKEEARAPHRGERSKGKSPTRLGNDLRKRRVSTIGPCARGRNVA